MNYIGSKKKLSNFIVETITNLVDSDLSSTVFCDLFAGTGIVGRSFKPLVSKVIANDLEYYSYVLNRHYIGNHQPIEKAESYIEELNSLKPTKGFIYTNYCLGSGSERQYFSDSNGQRIDAIRQCIEAWKVSKKISENTYYFLLTSLIEAADKVANTASVYGAYLKHLKASAKKELLLTTAHFKTTTNSHMVYQKDANALIKTIEGDILYLDPPYNNRQYGANYHLLNTIAHYKPFKPKGKTGLPTYNKSDYSSNRTVHAQFEELISNANFKYIVLSYNNEGLMSLSEIKSVMSKYGSYSLASTEYQRFKADTDSNRHHKAQNTTEFLHLLVK